MSFLLLHEYSSSSGYPSSWHISASWVKPFWPTSCLGFRFKVHFSSLITRLCVFVEMLLLVKPVKGLCLGPFSPEWFVLAKERSADECSQIMFGHTGAFDSCFRGLLCCLSISLSSPRKDRVRALGLCKGSFGNTLLIGGNSAGALVRRASLAIRVSFLSLFVSFSVIPASLALLWTLSLLKTPHDESLLFVNKGCFAKTRPECSLLSI